MVKITEEDKEFVNKCKTMWNSVYPDLNPVILGLTEDKKFAVIKTIFPDEYIYYFKVNEYSVSCGYRSNI